MDSKGRVFQAREARKQSMARTMWDWNVLVAKPSGQDGVGDGS